MEAYNRRDLDAYLLGFHSDCEFRPPREFVEAGFAEPCYRGAAGLREYVEIWFEAFGANLRVEHTCASCGARQKDPSARFCNRCGKPLTS